LHIVSKGRKALFIIKIDETKHYNVYFFYDVKVICLLNDLWNHVSL